VEFPHTRDTLTPVNSIPHHRPLLPPPSGRAAPAIIVATALAASTALFYFVTSKRLDSQRPADAQPTTSATSTAPPTNSVPPMKIPGETTPAPVAPPKPPTPPKPVFGFARPLDLGKDLAQSLARQDWTRAAQLATAGTPDAALAQQATDLFTRLQAMGFKAAPPEKVEVLGQVDRFTRLAIPFIGKDGQTQNLQLDLERDAAMGWKIAQFRLPPALAQNLTTPPAIAGTQPPIAGTPPAPMAPAATLFTVDPTPDALSFTHTFVSHLLKHDFTQARTYLDEARVPSERLAGLCIVFEEGQYALLPAKPLVLTVASENASWVIAQVQSEKLDQQTEFGIELQRTAPDQPWRVVGLNLSDILGSFARSASKLGVPYTPIVKNPKGGESLALYFEYDEAGLHPRAQKQLQIIADMLKSDSKRTLRIAGHTDARGAEDYNLRLSQQRAESVKKQLIALGVTPSQVDTTGLGTAQPLSPNQKSDGTDDPEGRSKNRRAEIYLDF
jgi:outer membrane protein OmpA-like peptidoglycan-associated protein